MARQMNFLAGGRVVTTALHTEMQQSYLEYAMSVIVGRALPDVRDGLKPVHRRILYAMHELGLTPDRPFRKCARVVGDVLGKYHPHGDQAVYDALVRLVQEFSSRYPLLAGHGNFGSVDDDPPAAMRYTETRLSSVSHEALLGEISQNTVDFAPNFDNSQQEPTLLPAQLPFLLLNGCSGIAVGMATNVPPHNLGEIVDGLIALIDHPQLTDQELMALIPGPDFPTGGEILGQDGIRDAYLTGRGSITVRGVVSVEESQPGRGRHRRPMLVVTELPFQVNKAAWVEKVADLVNQGKVEGVADVRDESDRDGMRVVIELRREANPQITLAQLYKQTNLQTTFGAILLALVDGQPRQLSLRELLQQFLDFREATLTRRYTHELQQAQARSEVLRAMLTALDHLDTVIDILRHSPDGGTAKLRLQERFDLSDRQTDAILGMPLRRLTTMERQSLQTEFDQLTQRMAELRRLLENRRELLKAMKKDLRSLKRRFSDDRRTRIHGLQTVDTPAVSPPLPPSEPTDIAPPTTPSTKPPKAPKSPKSSPSSPQAVQAVVVEITQDGYVWRRPADAVIGVDLGDRAADPVRQAFNTSTDQTLIVVTTSGKAYPIPIRQIPSLGQRERGGQGLPLTNFLPASVQGDEIMVQFLSPTGSDDALTPTAPTSHLIVLTSEARIKRLSLEELAATNPLNNRGLSLFKLEETEQVCAALLVSSDRHSLLQLVIATSGGRIIRLPITDAQIPLGNRSSQGIKVTKLAKQEQIIGCAAVEPSQILALISAAGYGKRMAVDSVRLSNRGDLGTQAFQFSTTSDRMVGLVALPLGATSPHLWLYTTAPRSLYLPADHFPLEDKDGRGDRVVSLMDNETVLRML